jgi:hypothetical protein
MKIETMDAVDTLLQQFLYKIVEFNLDLITGTELEESFIKVAKTLCTSIDEINSLNLEREGDFSFKKKTLMEYILIPVADKDGLFDFFIDSNSMYEDTIILKGQQYCKFITNKLIVDNYDENCILIKDNISESSLDNLSIQMQQLNHLAKISEIDSKDFFKHLKINLIEEVKSALFIDQQQELKEKLANIYHLIYIIRSIRK